MKFRLSFLLVCFLAINVLSATESTNPSYSAPDTNWPPCEVDPPNDLHIVEQGPTSVTFEFTPIIDAAQHRIKIHRSSDGLLVKNTVVPAGITRVTINDIPFGENHYATINTICEIGNEGDDSGDIAIIALILDLIVSGYSPEVSNPECYIKSANQQCYFEGDGTITPFEIRYNNSYRRFGVQRSNTSPSHWIVNLDQSNEGQYFKFFCANGESATCLSTYKVFVVYEPAPNVQAGAAYFELLSDTESGDGIFSSLWMSGAARFIKLAPIPGRPGETPTFIRDRDASNPENFELAFASPNPFANVLDVFPGRPEAQNIQLQLFNLSGQKVLDQQFGGGQEQYTLSTVGLSSGFYLLRIEADGEVQTLKVIKSE